MNLKKELLEGFREWKSKLTSAIFDLNHKHPDLSRESNLFSEIFRKRETQQNVYAVTLQKSTYIEDILQSLMHMHCNRILGIDLLPEQKSYVYAYHALSTFSLQSHSKNITTS